MASLAFGSKQKQQEPDIKIIQACGLATARCRSFEHPNYLNVAFKRIQIQGLGGR